MSLDQKSYLEKILLQFERNTCKPFLLLIDLGVPNFMLPITENQ